MSSYLRSIGGQTSRWRPDYKYLNKKLLPWVSSVITHMSHWAVLCVARFSSYHFRLIHKDVENLKLRIAVVSTGHQQISFLFSQDIQIITSDNICIGRIN